MLLSLSYIACTIGTNTLPTGNKCLDFTVTYLVRLTPTSQSKNVLVNPSFARLL